MNSDSIRPSLGFRLLSKVYATGVSLRNFAYDCGILSSYEAKLPVISIGNISVGGSGKSPFTQYLVRALLERRIRPVILLRGYGGTSVGPQKVDISSTPAEVGDEAVMHKRMFGDTVSVVVARRRAQGARLIEQEKLGDLIVLDDGLQHRALRRTIDLMLFDASSLDEIRAGLMLPAGRLRESCDSALNRVHAIVAVERDGAASIPSAQFRNLPVFCAQLAFRSVYDAESGKRTLGDLAGREVALFSSIARPDAFKRMVDREGAVVKKELHLQDHDQILPNDWRAFLDSHSWPILTTAKDIVKLPTVPPGRVFVCELGCELSDSAEFWRFVDQRLKLSHVGGSSMNAGT